MIKQLKVIDYVKTVNYPEAVFVIPLYIVCYIRNTARSQCVYINYNCH